MDLKVNLAGLELEHPIMNAAGVCKLPYGWEGVPELTRSAASAVMVGSITFEERTGNSGEVYVPVKDRNEEKDEDGKILYSLNSLGLPNPGADYYKKNLPEMAAVVHKAGKFLFVSVAGFAPSEYAALTRIVVEGGADAVELNLSCPNVWKGKEQKQIACFNPKLVAEILDCFGGEFAGEDIKLIVKLSPFSDPELLKEAVAVIAESKLVKAVTAINTFPNAFSFDESGKPRITPAGGLAGLAGPALKPIGLGQVKQLRDLLPERIQIIGVGGITKGQDVLDYLRAGADAVQVATAFMDRGPKVFSELLGELVELKESAI